MKYTQNSIPFTTPTLSTLVQCSLISCLYFYNSLFSGINASTPASRWSIFHAATRTVFIKSGHAPSSAQNSNGCHLTSNKSLALWWPTKLLWWPTQPFFFSSPLIDYFTSPLSSCSCVIGLAADLEWKEHISAFAFTISSMEHTLPSCIYMAGSPGFFFFFRSLFKSHFLTF